MGNAVEASAPEENEDAKAIDSQDLQVTAGMFNLAGTLVHDEPQRAMLDAWAAGGLFAELPLRIDDEAVRRGFGLMDAWLGSYARGGRDDLTGALQREWLRLFVGAGAPEAPSWANYYLDPEQRVLGRETLNVRATYRAFGLELADEGKEPDDALGLMLRFMGFLIAREAQETDPDELDRLRLSQAAFLKDHILPWVNRWRYEGEKHAKTDFYRGAVLFTFGLIRWHAQCLGFIWKEDSQAFALAA